jgi:hypothetical protein
MMLIVALLSMAASLCCWQAESCIMRAFGSHSYRPQTTVCPIIFLFITV